jgi:hypothetical protein
MAVASQWLDKHTVFSVHSKEKQLAFSRTPCYYKTFGGIFKAAWKS